METKSKDISVKRLLYEEVAARIGGLIEQGTYLPGDRIPSIRELSRRMNVSINTIMEAYANLENMGVVEARPQSGYYVRSRLPEPAVKDPEFHAGDEPVACCVSLDEIPLRILRTMADPSHVPLGGGVPNPDLLPIDKLNRMLASESRRFRVQSVSLSGARGVKRLRVQLSRRMLHSGCTISPDDIVVTSGCVEAVTLALQAVCRPGDTVAVGSPVFYTFLHSIQWMGLKIVEIPSTHREGMNIDVLEYALRNQPIHACLVIANFNNPLGYVMPEENKRRLAALLAKHDIPLIEDDVYGDLAFGPERPAAVKAYDEKGTVLQCSSFSKTLAPGYRVGWIVPGRYGQRIRQLKSLFNIATATPTQLAMAEFLVNGGYDHHLRTIRRAYRRQMDRMRDAVGRFFPVGTRVTRPEGGFILWVEMPGEVDSRKLYEMALREGISVAPGTVFSTTGVEYGNCIRLNAAYWSGKIEQALETVGGMAGGMQCARR
ncbi:MAG: PLP-dependent aminotransferase family protein [Deltaproteobacteria bacterium]|nr:PLP-dependent aminotransferase family protein [Deltaproteobacteria bacterium]